MLRGIGHITYGLWFLTVFTCGAVIIFCCITVIPGEHRRRRAARKSGQIAFRLTCSWPTIKGLETLPNEAAIVVANHASYLDGLLLTAVLPHHYRFVIKREVSKVPLMNYFLERIGAHFVERFDPHRGAADTRKIMQTADGGDSLAFFPEGTFHAEPGLRRFHKGAFKVAARKSLPLVPLTINGTRLMLPAKKWLPRPAPLEIIVSQPLQTRSDSPLADLMDTCRQQILDNLDEPDLTVSEQTS